MGRAGMDRRYAAHRGECGSFRRELWKWRRIRAMSQLDLALAVGTSPRDVLLEELRIKLFFPADAASATLFQRLAEPKEIKLLQPA